MKTIKVLLGLIITLFFVACATDDSDMNLEIQLEEVEIQKNENTLLTQKNGVDSTAYNTYGMQFEDWHDIEGPGIVRIRFNADNEDVKNAVRRQFSMVYPGLVLVQLPYTISTNDYIEGDSGEYWYLYNYDEINYGSSVMEIPEPIAVRRSDTDDDDDDAMIQSPPPPNFREKYYISLISSIENYDWVVIDDTDVIYLEYPDIGNNIGVDGEDLFEYSYPSDSVNSSGSSVTGYNSTGGNGSSSSSVPGNTASGPYNIPWEATISFDIGG